MNKLAKVIDMIFNLNELDNSSNLKDGRPGDALFTYYVSSSEDFMRFEPQTPQYKKLKNGEIVSLTLRITDQAGNVITDGPGTTVVLHICDCKICLFSSPRFPKREKSGLLNNLQKLVQSIMIT